jgi:hypothetical protein
MKIYLLFFVVVSLLVQPKLVLACGGGLSLHSTHGRLTGKNPVLGKIVFPTSAKSKKAQASFVEGVLLLHAFAYDLALKKFKEAAKLEPHFAMAYWGMALSRTYLVWGQEDWREGRDLLNSFASTPQERERFAPTGREKMYLRAVEYLYNGRPREFRLQAFSDRMGELAEKYPDDLEAKSFYALSLLGIINPEEFGYEKRGAAILEPLLDNLYAVLDEAPGHPGALHYLIHSLDTPKRAGEADPYLMALKNVAPDASHLVHMPSHISLRHGNWDQSILFNKEAFYISSHRNDFHALNYLHYSYLQKGPAQPFKQLADDVLVKFENGMGNPKPESDPGSYLSLAEVRTRQAIEWDEWSLMDTELPGTIAYYENRPWADEIAASQLYAIAVAALKKQNSQLFNGAMQALEKRRADALTQSQQALARGEPMGAERESNSADLISILQHQVKAEQSSEAGDPTGLRREMVEAIKIEDRLGSPPARLPFPMSPSHERFAELLWKHHQNRKEILEQLELVRANHPNRWRTKKLQEELQRN